MALTQKDLKEIEEIVKETIKEETRYIPTKDEFYTKMDEVIDELKTIREEQAAMFHRLSDHEDRISSLKDIHPGGTHGI